MHRLTVAALAAALCLVAPMPRLAAHEIPSDVRVKMFVKPESSRLRVLVRVPLASIVETPWPERRPGLLDLSKADELLRTGAISRIADDLEIREEDRALDAPRVAAVKASLPADRSFDSYEAALAYVTGPRLPDDTEFVISQGFLDALFEYSIRSDRSAFAIRPNFQRLGVTVQTDLVFQPPDGPERLFSLHNDPGLVYLDPTFVQVAAMFVRDGFRHIVRGADHLLFLFVLVLPFRPALSYAGPWRRFRRAPSTAAPTGPRVWPLVAIVTSFTVAHSVALIASAYDMTPSALWFPAFVDALVAASILYVALENLIAPDLRRRWMVAFGFGLAHGFAFASGLRDSLQFSGSHFLTSLLSFNLGLELGLLAALAGVVLALALVVPALVDERLGVVILSLLVAHTGWHWTLDRYDIFRRYQFVWPALDAAFFVIVIRWLMVAVVLAGLAWLIFGVLAQRRTMEAGKAGD